MMEETTVGSPEWLVNRTAEKSKIEEIAFEQQEAIDSISDICAKQKQKETMPKLLKEVFG